MKKEFLFAAYEVQIHAEPDMTPHFKRFAFPRLPDTATILFCRVTAKNIRIKVKKTAVVSSVDYKLMKRKSQNPNLNEKIR